MFGCGSLDLVPFLGPLEIRAPYCTKDPFQRGPNCVQAVLVGTGYPILPKGGFTTGCAWGIG